MTKSIKYIGFYDDEINKSEERYYTPASKNKMDYVCSVLNRLGHKVDIISPSCTVKPHGIYGCKQYQVNPQTTVHLPFCFGAKGIFRIARHIWQLLVNNLYLRFQICNGDTLIVYHSVSLAKTVVWLKKHKKIKLILHVEEIYADVTHNEQYRKKEAKAFRVADGFIFPTLKLNEVINMEGKPIAIAHGCYNVEERIKEPVSDGITHCIYAGTFDQIKGGCMLAIEAAKFLTDKYCLHVIGFGSPTEEAAVCQKINEVNKVSKCKVIYDGQKKGRDFLEYLQMCHIGISSQNPNGLYNDTSFPSKVLTYLVNGLKVVTIRIPVLESSNVNDFLYYFDKYEPQNLALAIMDSAKDLNTNCVDTRINELDANFAVALENVIHGE